MDVGNELNTALSNVFEMSSRTAQKQKVAIRLLKLVYTLEPNQIPIQPPGITQINRTASDPQRIQTENERLRVEKRLEGFDFRQSQAWKEICDCFGSSLSQNELLSIAQIIAFHAKLKLDREAKRRKEVLIKWFQENLTVARPYLKSLILEDCEGKRLGAV